MTDPGAERLRAIHEQMTTDPEMVRALADDLTQEPDAPIARITVGETNEVYEVQAREPVILRINHETDENFEREEWALGQARDKGLPVPTILRRGAFSDRGSVRHYEAQAKLPGTPFSELIDQGMSVPDRHLVAHTVGVMLAELNQIPTTGFGDLDGHGQGEHPTLEAWFAQMTAKRQQLMRVCREYGLDPALCAEAVEMLRWSDGIFAGATPHLVHDDLAPKHVLVDYDGDRPYVSGLIDWELAKSGYLGHEIPEWELRHANSVPVQWVLDGYNSSRQLSDDDMERHRIAAVHKHLVLLDYYGIDAPFPQMARTSLDALSRLVR